MRVAIYARVSTEDQTLDQQIEPLKEWCQTRGHSYMVFSEKVSGAKSSRRELDLLMQKVRQRQFEAVLIYKLDRLGRSLKHLLQITEELNNKGVQFICLNPEIDTKSPNGRFFMQVMGAVAELEREMIRERTRSKLSYLKKQGKRLGRPKGSKDRVKRSSEGYRDRFRKLVVTK